MTRKFIVAAIAAALAWAVTGCATSTSPPKPNKTVAVQLDASKKSWAFNARVLNLLTITLPPAAANHLWQISFHDPRYLKQMSEIKSPANTEAGTTISFLVLNTGRTRLRFVLVPPNSDGAVTPIDQQEIIFTVQ